MSSFLLDTNVVSEATRSSPDPSVAAFLRANTDLWLCAVVLHELEFGLMLKPPGRRRDALVAAHNEFVSLFRGRVLPLDRSAAERAAQFRAESRRAGESVGLGDTLIAGTSAVLDLTLATRNTFHFEIFDIDIINPWEHSPS